MKKLLLALALTTILSCDKKNEVVCESEILQITMEYQGLISRTSNQNKIAILIRNRDAELNKLNCY